MLRLFSNIPDAVSARQLLLDLDLGVQLADHSVAGQDARWFLTDEVEIQREEEGRGRDANADQGLNSEGTEDYWDAEVFDMCFCRCGQLAVSKTQRPKSSSHFLYKRLYIQRLHQRGSHTGKVQRRWRPSQLRISLWS